MKNTCKTLIGSIALIESNGIGLNIFLKDSVRISRISEFSSVIVYLFSSSWIPKSQVLILRNMVGSVQRTSFRAACTRTHLSSNEKGPPWSLIWVIIKSMIFFLTSKSPSFRQLTITFSTREEWFGKLFSRLFSSIFSSRCSIFLYT